MALLVVLFKMMEGCYIEGSIWTKLSILVWLLRQAGSWAWAEFSYEGVECLGGETFLGKILCMGMVNPRLSSCWHFWAVKNKLLNKWSLLGPHQAENFDAALALFGVGGSMGLTASCHLSSAGGGFLVSSDTGYFYFDIWPHGHFFIQVFGKPLKST